MTFNSKKGGKKIPQNFYPVGFYKEILSATSMRPETRQSMEMLFAAKMEFTQSSEECRSDQQGDENHL